MYEIRFNGSKVKKQFLKLLKKLSPTIKQRLKQSLSSYPYPSPTYGNSRNVSTKIEKKGRIYCYEVTGGDRILYDIIESPNKIVFILFAGNDDDEIRFLQKYAK